MTDEVPTFFVPEVEADDEETVYEEFADFAGRSVPEEGNRVYSITFIHDGEEWTATVGERLKGTDAGSDRKRNRYSDPATVLAIFPPAPYRVVTNKFVEGMRSEWANPFLAGEPESVTYFN